MLYTILSSSTQELIYYNPLFVCSSTEGYIQLTGIVWRAEIAEWVVLLMLIWRAVENYKGWYRQNINWSFSEKQKALVGIKIWWLYLHKMNTAIVQRKTCIKIYINNNHRTYICKLLYIKTYYYIITYQIC